ncbi:MAG TPA: TOBE domain-containing protein, partial [Gemmatimonadales bacterium]|nr:TOBE domain-containing protein [Gemmatimonadales bacterium]
LDEPLSNLDPTLRERTRRELRDVIRRVGITTVLVTHEQEEAFDLGDRVAVLKDGRLEQVGIPDDLYAAPVGPFVAGFVGRASELHGHVVGRTEHGVQVEIEGCVWSVPADAGVQDRIAPGADVQVLLRPEALWLAPPEPGLLAATVLERRFAGPNALYLVRTNRGAVIEVSGPRHAARHGDRVGLAPSRRSGGGIHLFPDRS